MNGDITKAYAAFEKKFIDWALTIEDIRAAFIVGSRARQDHPADEFSDLDIIIYTTNPDKYLMNSKWLENIGTITCSFAYKTAGGDPERLSLFEGGWQIDFVIHEYNQLIDSINTGRIPTNFYRGVRTIINKENISIKVTPDMEKAFSHLEIKEDMFVQNVNMFWFVSLYIAKQILRGELWVAKSRDSNIKELLLQMIEWHSKIINGNDYDTWHAGRFLNEWVSNSILHELKECFGRYNTIDSWQALIATINLFKRISHEIADLLGYTYPINVQNNVIDWIKAHEELV